MNTSSFPLCASQMTMGTSSGHVMNIYWKWFCFFRKFEVLTCVVCFCVSVWAEECFLYRAHRNQSSQWWKVWTWDFGVAIKVVQISKQELMWEKRWKWTKASTIIQLFCVSVFFHQSVLEEPVNTQDSQPRFNAVLVFVWQLCWGQGWTCWLLMNEDTN